MKEEFVSKQQLKLLPERIQKAEETKAAKKVGNYISWLDIHKSRVMIVGAGGAYPAAILAKHVLHEELRVSNVEAVTPQTAIRILTQYDYIENCFYYPEYDVIFGISYTGKEPAIKALAEICKGNRYDFVLLTGAEKSTLDEFYAEIKVKVVSYFNEKDTTGKEIGRISMFSTLIPGIIFSDSLINDMISEYQKDLSNGEKFVGELNCSEIATSLKKCPVIHVFYEWDTLPTAIDIEGKFTRSGIANVVLHEKKDFSDGRYTLLYNQPFAVVINLTRYRLLPFSSEKKEGVKTSRHQYDEQITQCLGNICKEKSAHYLEIGTGAISSVQWNIEAMTKIPYLITAIGEELGIDISEPSTYFSEEMIQLYQYKGKF